VRQKDVKLKKKVKVEVQRGSPFPSFAHPTHEESRWVCNALAKLHGMPKRLPKGSKKTSGSAACGEVPNVVQSVVRTILSQNTTQENGSRAYKSLESKFGHCNWEAIHHASLAEVSEAIKCGGLGNTKAKYIKMMLDDVYRTYRVFSLDHLHEKSDEEALQELVSFQGVGPKTASCVLLFCLKRSSFAVDTHIWRITKKLGWVPKDATREQSFLHLDQHLPTDIKYPLHVLLIRHGKVCKNCAANGNPRQKIGRLEITDCPLRGKMVKGKDKSNGKKDKKKKKKNSKKGEEEEEEKEEEEEEDEEDEREEEGEGEEEEAEPTKVYVAEKVSLEVEGSG